MLYRAERPVCSTSHSRNELTIQIETGFMKIRTNNFPLLSSDLCINIEAGVKTFIQSSGVVMATLSLSKSVFCLCNKTLLRALVLAHSLLDGCIENVSVCSLSSTKCYLFFCLVANCNAV
jgi:hypothetical protein